jgi:isoleucyl-tRNA synthetase
VRNHAALIGEELNVHSVEVHEDEAGLVDLSARANFKVLGPRLGRDMKTVASGIEELDHSTIADLLDGGSVEVNGFRVTGNDIVVSREPRSGTVVATDGPISVALDTTIDDALALEGMARELINRIQSERRRLDLDVSDRIVVRWGSDDALVSSAFDAYIDLITGEVLATDIVAANIDAEPIPIGRAAVSLEIAVDPRS